MVVLKNGDRVTGIIESLADGKLHMKTDAMADVTIDMAKVMTFSTDEPIVLVFKDGTVVHQKVAAAEDGMVAVQAGGLLAPQDLALADLAAANPPEKPKVKWTGHLTFGATKTTGNSRSTTASGDASLERRTEDDRITVNGYYLYAQSEDPSTNIETTTTDKWFVERRVRLLRLQEALRARGRQLHEEPHREPRRARDRHAGHGLSVGRIEDR